MSKQLSSRDYETLSAYLDGELSPKDMQRVELRLQASPELRDGLAELKYTQRLLKKVPMRRAPRNFIIKPSMLPQKRQLSPFYPALRLASALASILLVVAFASDLFLSMGLSKAVGRISAPAAQPITTQVVDSQAAQGTQGPLTMAPQAPSQPTEAASQKLGIEQVTPTEQALSAMLNDTPASTDTPSPTEQAPMTAMGIMTTSTPTVAFGLGGGPIPDETQTAIIAQTNAPPGLGIGPLTVTNTPEAGGFHYFDTPTPDGTSDLASSERSAMETPALETGPVSTSIDTQAPTQVPTPIAVRNLFSETPEHSPLALRLAEIILAVTALGTGAAAIVLRMRGNS
jgi:hypothetical protein